MISSNCVAGICVWAQGRAVHSALGENLAQKVDTREDLPTGSVVALFRGAWASPIEQTELRDEEDRKKIRAAADALVTKYMDQTAPTIDPAAVEFKVERKVLAPLIELMLCIALN